MSEAYLVRIGGVGAYYPSYTRTAVGEYYWQP